MEVSRHLMRQELLFGTTNPRKFQDINAIAKTVSISLLAPWDLGLRLEVEEAGSSAEENAVIKATAYAKAAGMVTLALDSGLLIDGLTAVEQPGVHVRRVGGRSLSDEEMIQHYAALFQRLGGNPQGRWVTALAICSSEGGVRSVCVEHPTQFTAVPSQQHNPGNPLNSLQVDVHTGYYYSEQSPQARHAARHDFGRQVADFLGRELG